jgi:signal transduction histidine kinase
VRRTLDVESFQGLLDNLALTRKVHGIAVTDADGVVVFSTERDQIGSPWRDPPSDANLLMVNDRFPLGTGADGTLRIALTTDDARQVLAAARRNLTVLSTAASLIGVIGLLSVFGVERRHQARVDAMQDALHQQERLADLGRMAATVAHEIRNPLNALGLTAQRLERRASGEGDPSDVHELSGLMRQEIDRLDRTVETFLNLARPASTTRRLTDLNEICGSVVSLYHAEAESLGVTLSHKPAPESLPAHVDPDQVHQAVSNLIRNAMDATPRGGVIVIGARNMGNAAVLWVEDGGPGFSPEALEQATDAFYSTKARGMGLGLTFADRVARDHGGTLMVSNRAKGAVVELHIALSRKGAQ